MTGMAVAFFAAAILFWACARDETAVIDFEQTPVQVVHGMSMLQTDKGEATMRMHAPVMKRYSFTRDSVAQSYELYTDGFFVDAYTEQGELETTIVSEMAKHVTTPGQESWSAFGNVVITNHIKGQRMETDTIYWNREEKQIYTDCYVRLTSDSGLMQGYGMTSDERAANAVILHPFDWYAIDRDSTYTYVDTVNLMGPKKL